MIIDSRQEFDQPRRGVISSLRDYVILHPNSIIMPSLRDFLLAHFTWSIRGHLSFMAAQSSG